MGSWAFCQGGFPRGTCDYGFDKPTIVEAFTHRQVCAKCGTVRHLDIHDVENAAQDIEDRLTALEKKFTDPIGYRAPGWTPIVR